MYKNLPLRAKSKGILLDAQLLTALIVGSLGEGEVERFTMTRQFSSRDAAELSRIVKGFSWTCATPHVLAEASNLLDWLDGDRKSAARRRLTAYVCNVREAQVWASEIVRTPVCCTLGITGAGLIMLAQEGNCTVFTADLPLYHYAARLRLDVVNFNHIRDAWL